MGSLDDIFTSEAKVVISPDKMRAWVMLPPPQKGAPYTVAAINEWLLQKKVVFGVSQELIKDAIESQKYHELLEVAKGVAPVNGTQGNYALMVEKRPFTGLKGASDGSLFYDDLSFLQEVNENTILAEVSLPDTGSSGKTVTDEVIVQKSPENSRVLEGTGFEITDSGRYYRAPSLSHVSIVNNQLVVTPLLKCGDVSEGEHVEFEGNILVDGDVQNGASIEASGSIFVTGRAASCTIVAGRNLLLCNGLRAANSQGRVDVKDTIWALCFEGAEITSEGDLYANHLVGCEAKIEGRASILGGRGCISNTNIYARDGVVAARIGADVRDKTVVSCGMDSELLGRIELIENRTNKLTNDIQAVQQNIQAFERLNRMKPDKGKKDSTYLDMIKKRDNSINVLEILKTERTRLKRVVDNFSVVSVIAREGVSAGVVIIIDTRELEVKQPLKRVKFRRAMEIIEAVSAAQNA